MDLEAIKAHREAAATMIGDLCQGRREWMMSIPARRDYDPDLVIAASLDDIPELLAEVERLQRIEQALKAYRMALWHDRGVLTARSALWAALEGE